MKILITILVTAGLVVVILRSNLTPWRLVTAADLKAADLNRNPPPPQIIERRILVPAANAQDHSGDWMRDPNYRTGLEKTSLAGRPENAIGRDRSKPASTPAPRPSP